jgi:hypothetical protein
MENREELTPALDRLYISLGAIEGELKELRGDLLPGNFFRPRSLGSKLNNTLSIIIFLLMVQSVTLLLIAEKLGALSWSRWS